MAPENEPHGPDGFPLCKNCGQQRRSERADYPGFCAECVALGRAGDPVNTQPAPANSEPAPSDDASNTEGAPA